MFRAFFRKLPPVHSGWIRSFLTPRLALAAVAGLALALSFPTFDAAILAWLAPGLMLLAALGASGRGAFGVGYFAGLVHGLVSLHWLLYIPFPTGAVAAWLALSAYVALYPATWVWLCSRVLLRARPRSNIAAPTPPTWAHRAAPRHAESSSVETPAPAEGVPGVEVQPPEGVGAMRGRAERWLGSVLDLSWSERAVWCLMCAAVWVALEMILARLFSGFPWNFLGVSQYQALPLIQIASATGVYGVSFVVVWCSMALLCAGVTLAGKFFRPGTDADLPSLWRPRGSPRTPALSRSLMVSFRFSLFADLALPLLALALVVVAGGLRLIDPARAETGRELRVAVIQPSIPQRLIFDPRESTNRFNAIMELSRLALAAKPDLLVWPEASLPGFEETHFRALTNLIATHRVWMVFGADDAEAKPGAANGKPYAYYNSAFLFDPDGRFVATYRKRRLVIFGEYVPLERWLPFAKYLTPIEGSFSPGAGPVPFRLTQPRANLSVLICFEDVFPEIARESVDADTDFLLNLTNNGWFGESAAQWQEAANAVFRAVENRVPLVRCTNNGLTCWIDALGRLREVGFERRDDIYGPGFKTFRIPLLPVGPKREPTVYQRYGDAFGWGCVGLTLAAGAWRWGQRRETRRGG